MLAGLDYGIIAIYMVGVLALGLWLTKQQGTSEDFFLAGRSLSFFSVGNSLFASNISSATLIGLAGVAYQSGIAVSSYEWMAAPILFFAAIYLVPYYFKTRITTLPEFLEKRFDYRLRFYFSGLTIIGNIFVDLAAVLYAGALVLTTFFPSLSYMQAGVILCLVAGLYTAGGGLKAVVYTDVVQAIILLVGSIVISWIAWNQLDMSWAQFVASTPEGHLSLIRPMDDAVMPWPGLLFGVPILGLYYWCTNQYIVQRILGAKNITQARLGAMLAGALKLTALFIMVLPGVWARNIFPDLEVSDQVFVKLVTELLPVGIKGLVLSGLIAAIMSSIDSTLHSASTLITFDFVKNLRPQTTDKGLMNIGRLTTISIMIISILWIPVVASFSTLFSYLQNALSYLVPQVVAVFLLGVFFRGSISRHGAFWGMIAGHLLAIIFFALAVNWHFLYLAIFFFCITITFIYILSLFMKDDETASWNIVIDKVVEAKKYLDYRIYGTILMILTVWMLWAWR